MKFIILLLSYIFLSSTVFANFIDRDILEIKESVTKLEQENGIEYKSIAISNQLERLRLKYLNLIAITLLKIEIAKPNYYNNQANLISLLTVVHTSIELIKILDHYQWATLELPEEQREHLELKKDLSTAKSSLSDVMNQLIINNSYLQFYSID